MSDHWRYFDLAVEVDREPLTPFDLAIDELNPHIEALVSMNFSGRSQGTFIYWLDDVTEKIISSTMQYNDIRHAKSTRFSDDQLGVLINASMSEKYLLNRLMQHPIIIDTPIEFTGKKKADLRVTGPDELVHEIYEELGNSDGIQLGTVGSCQLNLEVPANILTKRQREILFTAMRDGYYDVPRGIDHHELSEKFGVAPQTVGEHLRKSEAKLINHNALNCEGVTITPCQPSREGQRGKP